MIHFVCKAELSRTVKKKLNFKSRADIYNFHNFLYKTRSAPFKISIFCRQPPISIFSLVSFCVTQNLVRNSWRKCKWIFVISRPFVWRFVWLNHRLAESKVIKATMLLIINPLIPSKYINWPFYLRNSLNSWNQCEISSIKFICLLISYQFESQNVGWICVFRSLLRLPVGSLERTPCIVHRVRR